LVELLRGPRRKRIAAGRCPDRTERERRRRDDRRRDLLTRPTGYAAPQAHTGEKHATTLKIRVGY
jgi:hypothetical protein